MELYSIFHSLPSFSFLSARFHLSTHSEFSGMVAIDSSLTSRGDVRAIYSNRTIANHLRTPVLTLEMFHPTKKINARQVSGSDSGSLRYSVTYHDFARTYHGLFPSCITLRNLLLCPRHSSRLHPLYRLFHGGPRTYRASPLFSIG